MVDSCTGGEFVARILAQEGVTHLFTLSGGCLAPIYDACRGSGIEIIHTRSEAGAGFMADGWARATGKVGVFAVTTGPGVTNSVTTLMTSKLAGSPVVLLAGRHPGSLKEMGGSQAIDHIPIVTPATKWAESVLEPDSLSDYLHTAFRQALSGRPGPAFLDILSSLLMEVRRHGNAPSPANYRPEAKAYPDPEMVEKAIALLGESRRPVLLAGSGVFWSGAGKELSRFVEATRIPTFVVQMGRGSIPRDSAYHFGIGSLYSNPVAAYAIANCDLALVVGARIDEDLEYGQQPYWSQHAKVVQVDIEAEEIGRNRPVEVGIVADVATALSALGESITRHIAPDEYREWSARLQLKRTSVGKNVAALASSSTTPIHPLRLLSEIEKVTGPDDTLVVGHGNVDFWGDSFLDSSLPGHYLRAGTFGPLGAEIPYGLAAQLARPRNRVIVLVGDGGFGYSAMELETAARYGLPVVVVIGNDSGWGLIRKQQEFHFGEGRTVGTDLRPWHYEQMAKAIGCHGEYVDSPAEILPALKRALDSGVPACVNVLIDSVTCPYMSWQFHKMRRDVKSRILRKSGKS